MNSPREFCRLPKAHTTILLTYDFDAIFFERIVLNDLWAGETGDVLVLADAAQVSAAAASWGGQLKHLGRRYQLAPATTTGRFHPKVILRLGKEGGYVWVGSGNLTHGGWGGNRELCAAWEMGPGRADTGGWVYTLLERVASWGPAGLSHDVVRRAMDLQWVVGAAGSPAAADATLLTSFGGSSLSGQLKNRWAGRRFTEARIFTGSTDEGGAQLRWLHEEFGVERALVVLDQSRASFQPDLLSALPLEVSVRHLPRPTTHAKCYWLDGPDGPAAVMGSANCSFAAWLRPPASGGNVEAVVVYDRPVAADFAPILDYFDSPDLVPAELKPAGTVDTESLVSVPVPKISEIVWDENLGEVRITFSAAPDIESVTLMTGEEILSMRPVGRGGIAWAAELLRPLEEGVTAFVLVETRFGGGFLSRHRSWVNHLSELRNAAQGHRIADRLSALTTGQAPGEQRRLVEDLHRISLALANEPETFPDTPGRAQDRDPPQPVDEAEPWEAINPEEFVVSINDLRRTAGAEGGLRSTPVLSLAGVLRAFFGAAGPQDADDEAEYMEDPKSADDDQSEGDNAGAVVTSRAPVARLRAPEPQNSARLANSMEQLLTGMGGERFASTCTVTQLVQAVAFPLAVATLGRRDGWVDDAAAQNWVRRVSDLLFTRRHGGAALLGAVRERYRAEGREQDFLKVAGDGTLWIALLASLSGAAWEGNNVEFERAFTLRAVFKARDLIASGDAGRMAALLDRLGERQARAVLEEVPEATRLLDALEEHLCGRWDQLTEAQRNARPFQHVGDLLWHPKAGWAELLEEKEWGVKCRVYLRSKAAQIIAGGGFYLNVTRAAEDDALLRARIEELESGRHVIPVLAPH